MLNVEQALTGRVQAHHRLLLRELLDHVDCLDRAIGRVSTATEERTRPFAAALALLCSIPGVQQRTAEVLLAEIGADMGRFPSARHLCSWAAVCPGNHESGGARLWRLPGATPSCLTPRAMIFWESATRSVHATDGQRDGVKPRVPDLSPAMVPWTHRVLVLEETLRDHG